MEQLLAQFADPETLATMSLGQRLLASLFTTLLGMGITFLSLIILQLVIGLLARLAAPTPNVVQPVPQATAKEVGGREDEELVAAITVALAMQLGTSTNAIMIRSLRKIEDHTPVWSRTGLTEQMSSGG